MTEEPRQNEEPTDDSDSVPDPTGESAPDTTPAPLEPVAPEPVAQPSSPTSDSSAATTPASGQPQSAPDRMSGYSSRSRDDVSDAGAIPDVDENAPSASSAPPKWEYEMSAHRIAVELKRIENEVWTLLDGSDTKRKRRLAGSRRWMELEDDIRNWRYGGRFDEAVLDRLQQLVCRRNYLFTRLRFSASTRPVWNS